MYLNVSKMYQKFLNLMFLTDATLESKSAVHQKCNS